MKYFTRTLIVAGLATFALLMPAQTQTQEKPAAPSSNRGIYVDRVKVFSDADLRAKFRDLARQLSPLLGIDPAKITAGLFQTQGIEADRSNTAFTATGSPIPGSTVVDKKNFPPDKDPVTGKEVTTTNPQLTPSVPKSDLPADTLKTPDQIALSAPERIAEYMQLFYETTNLQMLLNRAISDIVDSGGTKARVPIILGIPVTVVADPKLQGAMAQIWVRVTPADGAKEPINVITQIPQENSYNVATITNHVSNVGLGAVTTLLNIGFSQTRQRERQYLVKTYDTISLSSFNGDANNYGAEFGWQLRPVLGNRNITPGRRTFMVALSLPPGNEQQLHVQVYTQWFRYDKRTGNVGHALTEQIRSSDTTKLVNLKNFSPALGNYFLHNGAPNAVEGRLIGTGFSPDLPYYSGGRRVVVSSSTDDMTSVQLSLTKDDLLTNDLRVGTIFGSLRPLQAEIPGLPADLTPDIFRKITAEAWEQSNDTYKVRLRLPGNWENLNNYCITQIGDFFPGFALKDRPFFKYANGETTSQYIVVPAKSIAGNKAVILSAPFYGFTNVPHDKNAIEDPYPPVRAETTLKVYDAFSITKVVQSGKGDGKFGKYTVFTLTGRGLRDLAVDIPDILEKPVGGSDSNPKTKAVQPRTVNLQISGGPEGQDSRAQYFQSMFKTLNAGANKSASGEVFLVPISDDALKFTKIFVVTKKVSDNGAPFDIDDQPGQAPTRGFTRVVSVELKKEDPPEPEIKSIDSVNLNHIGAVTVHGEHLDRIKKVLIGKDEVKFVGPEEVPAPGDKKETVYYIVLPASIAKTAGPRTVVFILDDDSIKTASFTVKP